MYEDNDDDVEELGTKQQKIFSALFPKKKEKNLKKEPGEGLENAFFLLFFPFSYFLLSFFDCHFPSRCVVEKIATTSEIC